MYRSVYVRHGKFVTEVYDKRDNFNFNIVNYPFMRSNIPARPIYGVYISQLIRIKRICDAFVKRHILLTERLNRQGFWYSKLCNSFKKFAKKYNVELSKYNVSIRTHVSQGICIPLEVRHDLARKEDSLIDNCFFTRLPHMVVG